MVAFPINFELFICRDTIQELEWKNVYIELKVLIHHNQEIQHVWQDIAEFAWYTTSWHFSQLKPLFTFKHKPSTNRFIRRSDVKIFNVQCKNVSHYMALALPVQPTKQSKHLLLWVLFSATELHA